MHDTLRHVIESHGGLENWNRRKALSVDLVVGGMLWGLKGQFGKLERTNVTVGLGEEPDLTDGAIYPGMFRS